MRIVIFTSLAVMAAIVGASILGGGNSQPPASADPPPTPTVPAVVLPGVFCFRVMDIQADPGDSDKFTFEFEVLNWTDQAADGVELAVNLPHTDGIVITGSGIDADGRPITAVDTNGDTVVNSGDDEDDDNDGTLDGGEDQNGNGRLDNDPAPDNLGTANDWSANASTATKATWSAGTAAPNRDLLNAATTTAANELIPHFPPDPPGPNLGVTSIDGSGNVTPLEAIDDGNNVLDGFTVTLDDFDSGDQVQLNWFLTNSGAAIGTAGSGNQMGFGVVNLGRTDSPMSNPVVYIGNSGLGTSQRDFFDGVHTVSGTAHFAIEFGAGLTAAFKNPDDNTLGADINAEVPVGGVGEFPDDEAVGAATSASGGSGSASAVYAALAGGLAVGALALGAGGWYAIRRRRRLG